MATGTLASLTIRVGTSTRDAVRGLTQLDNRVKETKQKFTRLEDSTLSLRRAFGVLAGATGLAFAAKKVFDLGSAVAETANKFDVVMGPSASAMRRQLEELSNTVPLLVSEMEGLASGVQDMLVPMGLVRSDAAQMSVDMVALAGDLASFNNVAADVPLEAMKSALAGMSRPLRQFGVDVSQARLEAIALEEGLTGVGQEMDMAARAQAIFIAVQRDSSDAMGDAARTADSAANMMRFLQRDVRQVAENFSVALVPALQVFVGKASDGLDVAKQFTTELKNQTPVLQAWAQFAVRAGEFVAKAFAAPFRIAFNLGQAIGQLGVAFGRLARGDLRGAAEAGRQFTSELGDMWTAVTDIIDAFGSMREASGEAWQAVATEASDAVDEVLGQAARLPQQLGEVATGLVGVGSALIGPLRELPEHLNEPREALNLFARDVTETMGVMEQFGIRTAAQMGDAFADFATGARDAIRSFVADALRQLARLIARMVIVRTLSSFFPGVGSFLGVASPIKKFHTGGFMAPNTLGVVRKDEELVFAGAGGATVVPPRESGGATVTFHQAPIPAALSPRERALVTHERETTIELLKRLSHDGVIRLEVVG